MFKLAFLVIYVLGHKKSNMQGTLAPKNSFMQNDQIKDTGSPTIVVYRSDSLNSDQDADNASEDYKIIKDLSSKLLSTTNLKNAKIDKNVQSNSEEDKFVDVLSRTAALEDRKLDDTEQMIQDLELQIQAEKNRHDKKIDQIDDKEEKDNQEFDVEYDNERNLIQNDEKKLSEDIGKIKRKENELKVDKNLENENILLVKSDEQKKLNEEKLKIEAEEEDLKATDDFLSDERKANNFLNKVKWSNKKKKEEDCEEEHQQDSDKEKQQKENNSFKTQLIEDNDCDA